jgi:hypothetical protein
MTLLIEISLENPIELSGVLAYLRNNETRFNLESLSSITQESRGLGHPYFRVTGFWDNVRDTEEMTTDLRIKFPDINIHGLTDDDECDESSSLDNLVTKGSNSANNISLIVVFPTLLKYAVEWSGFKNGVTIGSVTHFVSAYFKPFANADNYSSSFPCPSSKNEEFEISYYLKCLPFYQDAYAKRIFEESIIYLNRSNAPSDVRLKLYCEENEAFLFETQPCDRSDSVSKKSLMSETHAFMERLRADETLNAQALLNFIESPLSKDMDVRDENGNSLLHLAAAESKIGLVPEEFLKLNDHFLSQNAAGQTVLDIARIAGSCSQLPIYMRNEKYEEDLKIKRTIQALDNNPKLTKKLLENFPSSD